MRSRFILLFFSLSFFACIVFPHNKITLTRALSRSILFPKMSDIEGRKYIESVEQLLDADNLQEKLSNNYIDMLDSTDFFNDGKTGKVLDFVIQKSGSSVLGAGMLARTIAQPFSAAQTRRTIERQKYISFLLDNPAVLKKIRKSHLAIKEMLPDILSWYLMNSQSDLKSLKSFFPSFSFRGSAFSLNQTARVSELASRMTGGGVGIAAYSVGFATTCLSLHQAISDGFAKIGERYEEIINSDAGFLQRYISYCGLFSPLFNVANLATAVLLMKKTFYSLTHGWYAQVLCHQRRLHAMSVVQRAFSEIQLLANKHDIIQDALSLYEVTHVFDEKRQYDQELDWLCTHFESQAFLPHASDYQAISAERCLWGRLATAAQIMYDKKDCFVPVLQAVAESEMCCAIAQTILYCNERHIPCSQVYLDAKNDATYIDMKNVWNCLIEDRKAIPNDITLGVPNDKRIMVITGSNSGGKSTFVNAVVNGIVMGQQLGFICAESGCFTPFDELASSINVTDDKTMGESKFVAEARRAGEILDYMRKNKGKRLFITLDELFNGTGSQHSEPAVTAVLEEFAASERVLGTCTTHFRGVCAIEDITNGICQNYNVDASKMPDGTYRRTYKCKKGVSVVNTAKEILARYDIHI